jgi:hypothetical protein
MYKILIMAFMGGNIACNNIYIYLFIYIYLKPGSGTFGGQSGNGKSGGETCRTYPISYTVVTGSLPGVKRPGRGVNHPPLLAPRLKKDESYTSGLRLCFRGRLYGFPLSVAFQKFSILVLICMLLLPDGQISEAWEHSKKQWSF